MGLWQNSMIQLARNDRVVSLVQGRRIAQGLAQRFVAGDSVSGAQALAEGLAERGVSVTWFYLGEYVTDSAVIEATMERLLAVIAAVGPTEADLSVSIDPSQIGTLVDEELAARRITTLAEALAAQRPLHDRGHEAVMLDMEDSSITDFTIAMHNRLRADDLPVAITVQAYLHRSTVDIAAQAEAGAWVRLVKGALGEGSDVATCRRADVDSRYRQAVTRLLSPQSHEAGTYPAFATHDERIIEETIGLAAALGWSPQEYEFEMLLGVREDLRDDLVARGHRVRVYMPFGVDWFPYAIRRVGESPRNLRFALRATTSH